VCVGTGRWEEPLPLGSPRPEICQRQAFQALPRAALLIPSLPRDILQALTQPSAPVLGGREAGRGQAASQGTLSLLSAPSMTWSFLLPRPAARLDVGGPTQR
jgi:hypothetical protein